jgi:hypothetical protein
VDGVLEGDADGCGQLCHQLSRGDGASQQGKTPALYRYSDCLDDKTYGIPDLYFVGSLFCSVFLFVADPDPDSVLFYPLIRDSDLGFGIRDEHPSTFF